MRVRILMSAFLLLTASVAASRAEQTFSSGPRQVVLLELFSSEGCSSCPPLEKWLGTWRDNPQLWHEGVPVAWHVNYWDRLGWKDVYAAKAYTNRQYAYAKVWRSSSVYTPCLVRNGREWRRGATSDEPKVDAGKLTLDYSADRTCCITFSPPDGTTGPGYAATVALLGNDVTSHVRAGENSGRNLHHEFIVLSSISIELKHNERDDYTATLSLPDSKAPAPGRYSIAVWVTLVGELQPLQATGGWLD